MRFWFQKSDKDAGTAYVGAEHEGVSGFATLHVGKRELAHAVSTVGAAVMLRELAKKTREIKRTQKDARRRLDQTIGPHKDPRRSTGMNLKTIRRLRKRKRR